MARCFGKTSNVAQWITQSSVSPRKMIVTFSRYLPGTNGTAATSQAARISPDDASISALLHDEITVNSLWPSIESTLNETSKSFRYRNCSVTCAMTLKVIASPDSTDKAGLTADEIQTLLTATPPLPPRPAFLATEYSAEETWDR